MTTEPLPPQALDAEQSLLGSMMLDRETIGDVLQIVPSDCTRWFYRGDHRAIFDALVSMYASETPVDIILLRNRLEATGTLEKVGGVEYLVQCAESVPTAVNAEHYAQIVRDNGMLRDLIRVIEEIKAEAHGSVVDAGSVLESAEHRIFKIAEKRITGDLTTLSENLVSEATLDANVEQGRSMGLETGFRELDEMATGLRGGDMVVLGARASMGKTALGVNMATNMVLSGAGPILFVSLEMSRQQISHRAWCSVAGVNLHRFRKRFLYPDERERLECAKERLLGADPFLIDDSVGITPITLRAKARRAITKHGIVAVFVDYLQLMNAIGRHENDQVRIAAISAGVKAVARDLDIPIVLLAQLNRAAETDSGDKRPSMRHLRQSGAIEQDADLVLLLHRPGYYKRDDSEIQTQAELIVAKQRNGPTGIVDLVWDAETATFKNKAAEQAYPVASGAPSVEEQAKSFF